MIDFEPIDRHFAALMQRLGADADVALAALLVSRAARQGDICLDLAAWAGTPLPEQNCATPSLDAWRKAVQSSPVVGSDNDYTPMVLDAKSRLYLRRYYDYEQCLAAAIRNLSARRQSVDWDKARRTLSALFPTESETIDYQALAAIAALATGFTVVTGGPGTGKTTTVAKILALILDQDHQARIALAAPTGKAADRLQASVRQAAARLACGDAVKAAMPAEAFTIHRLLGPLPDSPYFRHHALNPLPYDVVVVDEASMVDLALMAKLVDAVPQGARLILLGDRDQLASVQAGYVLGDLCDTGVEHAYSAAFAALVRDVAGYDIQGGGPAGFVDSIIELRTNYRFAPDSGIGRLSRQVNTGECSMIEAHDLPDLGFTPLPAAPLLKRHLKELIIQGYAPYLTATDPAERLERLNGFRVLCALKEGPYGVGALNALAEDVLESSGLIKPMGRQYHGRPVLITRNDSRLRLFNGDVGIILRTGDGLKAFFPGPEGRPRMFSPGRLPEHVTVFAMTVHKSQGSEFGHVLMVLPERDTPVLTRELVYTGITRARTRLDLWAEPNVLKTAVTRRIRRTSGLRDALWGS
ncbi:MAG TPA: exodeoxyribonuclease V subunit alpha [Deltaproteobacteria bacterium]|nr:exodeoxyribonuclease V subunit alpha [Deltaproteobacteria bacterium]